MHEATARILADLLATESIGAHLRGDLSGFYHCANARCSLWLDILAGKVKRDPAFRDAKRPERIR